MAKRRAVAAREDGGQLACVRRRACVAEQVDAAVERMEPPASEPLVDGIGSRASAEQLHHAMLAGSEGSDRPLTRDGSAGTVTPGGVVVVVVALTAYMAANPA